MDVPFEVTRRGPTGAPLEIACRSHPDCKWTLASTTWKTEKDPIFVAQFGAHLKEKSEGQVKAFGHMRRARM
jgi:hypothetical protein